METWGAEQEQHYLDRIWARFEIIGHNPEMHRQRPDLFPGCRIATEGKHVILFRADTGQLEIVRVLHSAMDYNRQLTHDPSSPE